MANEPVLQEIEKELNSVVKNIQQLTGSLGKIVAAVEKLAQAEPPVDLPAELPKTKAKRAPARKKVVMKNGVVEKIKKISATQIVYDLIQKATQGLDTAALMKATGYDKRKIHNIAFRLKKEGRIKTKGRGVYK